MWLKKQLGAFFLSVFTQTHAYMYETKKKVINLSVEDYRMGFVEGKWEGLNGHTQSHDYKFIVHF